MPKMIVLRKEIHYSHVEVDAESVDEAIAKVDDGEGKLTSVEYSHTVKDTSEWSCEDANGNHWYYDQQSGDWAIRYPSPAKAESDPTLL